MTFFAEMIGLVVMAVVALYLCSLVLGFRGEHTRRKKKDVDEYSAKVAEKILKAEREKQLEAETGIKRKKKDPRDFKQTR